MRRPTRFCLRRASPDGPSRITTPRKAFSRWANPSSLRPSKRAKPASSRPTRLAKKSPDKTSLAGVAAPFGRRAAATERLNSIARASLSQNPTTRPSSQSPPKQKKERDKRLFWARAAARRSQRRIFGEIGACGGSQKQFARFSSKGESLASPIGKQFGAKTSGPSKQNQRQEKRRFNRQKPTANASRAKNRQIKASRGESHGPRDAGQAVDRR